MKVVRDDIWLCSDCMIVAVNGDYSGLDYNYEPDEAVRKRQAEVKKRLLEELRQSKQSGKA